MPSLHPHAAASFPLTPIDELCFVWPKETRFLHLVNCLSRDKNNKGLFLFVTEPPPSKAPFFNTFELFRRVEYQICNPHHMYSLLDWFISRSGHYYRRPLCRKSSSPRGLNFYDILSYYSISIAIYYSLPCKDKIFFFSFSHVGLSLSELQATVKYVLVLQFGV
jgi:hypothetical protein